MTIRLNQIGFPVVPYSVQTHSKSVGRGIEFKGALNQLACEESVLAIQSTMHAGQGFQYKVQPFTT